MGWVKRNMKNMKIDANGTEIRVMGDVVNEEAYISLTDIAKYKNPDNAFIVVANWMRNHSTISFLGLWEQIHNPNFKPIEFDRFKAESGDNAFTLTPQQWIKATDAIGIVSKSGRYGGTYAHTDIVFEFASAEELVVLINLEDTNADLIRQEVPKIDRLKILREKVYRQLEILKKNQEAIETLKQNLIKNTDKSN